MTLSGICAIDAVCAQQAPSPFEPIAPPTITPEMLKTPQPAPNAGTDGKKFDKSGKEAPAMKAPNSVGLGKYELQFNAGQTRDIITRDGLDSGETSNLSKVVPGRKDNTVVPDYFGLKLTAPTH